MKSKVKQTHTATMRQVRELGGQQVQETIGMTESDYKAMIFEMGILFLTTTFKDGSTLYIRYSRDAKFWKWWRCVYTDYEQDLLKFCNDHQVELTPGLYQEEILVLTQDATTEIQFNTNYIKIIRNGKP